VKEKTDIKKLREMAEKATPTLSYADNAPYWEYILAANPQAIIELLDRLNEAESAIKDLELYWIGSYRGGESARRYALNWGLK